eukprot:gene30269-35257_t
MDMWKSLDSLKAVVSEGVREFGNATREGIQDIQACSYCTDSTIMMARSAKQD